MAVLHPVSHYRSAIGCLQGNGRRTSRLRLPGGWRGVLARSRVEIHKFEQRLPRRLLPQRFAPASFDWKFAEITENTFICLPRLRVRIHTSAFLVLNKSSFEYRGRINQIASKTRKRHTESCPDYISFFLFWFILQSVTGRQQWQKYSHSVLK